MVAPPLVFVSSLAEQIEWYSQLPLRLPSLAAGAPQLKRLPSGVLLSQTFGVGYLLRGIYVRNG
jgi:hypothetical protein